MKKINTEKLLENFFTDKSFKKILQPGLILGMIMFFINSPKILKQNIEQISSSEVFMSILFMFGFIFCLTWFIKNLSKKNNKKVIKFLNNRSCVKAFLLLVIGLYVFIIVIV